MTFLKKAWSWLKAHKLLLIAPFVALAFLILRSKSVVDWGRLLRDARQSHSDELKALEAAKSKEQQLRDQAFRRAKDAEEQVRREYDQRMEELDAEKVKRARQIIKQLKDNPEELQKELEAEGWVYVQIIR